MMKCYIVDDVISIVKILKRIIKEKNLCEIIGTATDAKLAEQEIIQYEPDIVLADLLMPDIDGITLVRNVKRVKPKINFIMISQVSNNTMVADAYKEGIEFFIRKPINIMEVEAVVGRVINRVEMEKTLGGIRQMIGAQNVGEVSNISVNRNDKNVQQMRDIKYILGLFGILGERGTKDILNLCELIIERDSDYDRFLMSEYAKDCHDDEKMVKQRIRRALKKGLANAAALGVEDYYNEIFQNYANMVFDFEAIRNEMDMIRGKNSTGGKASISKFIDGMITLTQLKE